MAVTTVGKGVFGLGANETGLITQSIGYSYNAEKAVVKDYDNSTVGVTYTDETVEISISAKVEDTTPSTATVASTLTLINAIPNHISDGVTGGTVLIDNMSIDKQMGEFNDISTTATYYPAIPSA